MNYIGIDPGVSGGIAVISVNTDETTLHCAKMPETDRDIADLLAEFAPVQGEAIACIEKVNVGVFRRPGAKMGVVSAATFMGNYRALKMALTCCCIPFDEVLAVKWQTEMGCRSRGDKNVTKRRAQALFPGVKITHAIADALLIAEFCRRRHSAATATTATPAQKELFDGKNEEQQEHPSEEGQVIEVSEDQFVEALSEFVTRGRNAARAAQATARLAAGNGRPRHRRD